MFSTNTENNTKVFKDEYEVDITLEGEEGFRENSKNCTKNPGHKNFIPFEKLTKEDLPARYRDSNLMLDCIKALADITVRIQVNYVSEARPKEDRYPQWEQRGTRTITTGTGKITHIEINRAADGKLCPCPTCRDLGEPEKEWGIISVFTARHVVYDDIEGKKTTCFLNFDPTSQTYKTLQADANGDGKLFMSGKPCIELKGLNVKDADTKTDWCRVECVHHNIQFVHLVDRMVVRYENLHRAAISELYKTRDEEKLAVIVSHPHGQGKCVTIGKWVERKITMMFQAFTSTRYTYTADTCPGTSGAPVYLFSTQVSNHAHRGVDPDSRINYSSIHFD